MLVIVGFMKIDTVLYTNFYPVWLKLGVSDLHVIILKADSHIACRAHAAPMLFPYHAMPLGV